MPYQIIPIGKDKVRVINEDSGRIVAKSTTLDKAIKQIKLLHYIDAHNK